MARWSTPSRPWTAGEVQILRRCVGKTTHAAIGAMLGRSGLSVKSYCRAHGILSSRRRWTEAERAVVRAKYRKVSGAVIARELGRTESQVHKCARRIGLSIAYRFYEPDMVAFIRQKNALGWSDSEIGAARRVDRHAVARVRKQLGLPSHAHGERCKEKLREALKRQLRKIGVATPGQWRVKVFRDRARAAGWPEDLRPRAVQMLNALWNNGPMTRREIADAIGMPWKGSRKSLVSNDPEGSYLAHLMNRGLVVVSKRAFKVTGQGKGYSCNIYSLPIWIERGKVA